MTSSLTDGVTEFTEVAEAAVLAAAVEGIVAKVGKSVEKKEKERHTTVLTAVWKPHHRGVRTAQVQRSVNTENVRYCALPGHF